MNSTPTLDFEIKRDIPLQEVNEEYCWFHPSAAAIPGAGQDGLPAVIMTIQHELAASDFYSGLYYMRTDDLGATWCGPSEIPELAWRHDGDVVIAVAGMDAALASVLGGLTAKPLLAVPTSIGYGVVNKGETALNSMLATCAQGVSVFNIDNGYGAACAAARIVSLLCR